MSIAIPAALALAFGAVTFARSGDWSDLYTLRMAMVRDHPNSAVANYEAGAAVANVLVSHPEFVATDYERAKTYFERSASLDRKNVNAQFGLILLRFSTDHPIEEELLEDVTARLSGLTFNFKFVEAFRSLVGWTTSGIAIPERTISRLFEAALSNQTVPARSRAIMLSLLSGYYYGISNDQEAVSLALAAVEQDPTEPSLQVRLADLAIQLGNHEVAAAALEAAARADGLGRWALERQRLTERLAQTRTANADGNL
jgi:hypothetical protein